MGVVVAVVRWVFVASFGMFAVVFGWAALCDATALAFERPRQLTPPWRNWLGLAVMVAGAMVAWP